MSVELRPRRPWRRRAVRTLVAAVVLIAVANVVVMLVSLGMSRAIDLDRPEAVEGIDHLHIVDGAVWRGAHPSREGYEGLAESGVKVVVDLRAEKDAVESDAVAAAAGLEVVHLPIRDGQLPSQQQVRAFVDIVEAASDPVFVHCGAGVGRTGAMVAAYLVETGQVAGTAAVLLNLAVGPPSLEQIWFAAGTRPGELNRPPAAVTAVSRVLDAPRRMLSYL